MFVVTKRRQMNFPMIEMLTWKEKRTVGLCACVRVESQPCFDVSAAYASEMLIKGGHRC